MVVAGLLQLSFWIVEGLFPHLFRIDVHRLVRPEAQTVLTNKTAPHLLANV